MVDNNIITIMLIFWKIKRRNIDNFNLAFEKKREDILKNFNFPTMVEKVSRAVTFVRMFHQFTATLQNQLADNHHRREIYMSCTLFV